MPNQNYFTDLESIASNLVEAPPSGTLRIANVANTLKQVNPDGTTASLGGGSSVLGVTASAGSGVSVNNTDPTNPIISGVAASSTVSGTMSAADKTFINSQSWESTARAAIIANDPTQTGFKRGTQIGIATVSGGFDPVVIDAVQEGWGFSPQAGIVLNLTRTVTASIKNNHWSIYWRGVFASPTSGHQSDVGMTDAGFSIAYAGVGRRFAASTTKYELELPGTPGFIGTATADGAAHNYLLACDGTNIKFYVDGVLDITHVSSVIGTSAGYVSLYSDVSSDLIIYDWAIGYVAP